MWLHDTAPDRTMLVGRIYKALFNVVLHYVTEQPTFPVPRLKPISGSFGRIVDDSKGSHPSSSAAHYVSVTAPENQMTMLSFCSDSTPNLPLSSHLPPQLTEAPPATSTSLGSHRAHLTTHRRRAYVSQHYLSRKPTRHMCARTLLTSTAANPTGRSGGESRHGGVHEMAEVEMVGVEVVMGKRFGAEGGVTNRERADPTSTFPPHTKRLRELTARISAPSYKRATR